MAKKKMKQATKRPPAKTAKATAKRTTKKAPAKKPPTHSRRPNPNRTAILAEMNKSGATAKVMAKKYGVSAWTIYGWRKNKGGKPGRPGRKPGRPAGTGTPGAGVSTAALREEIRAVLPTILREEITRAITAVLGGRKGNGRRRRQRGRKK